MPFILATFTVLLPFAAKLTARVSATPILAQADDIFSESQLLTWLSTTDAKLTYIGAPVRDIQARAGEGGNVTVVYCSTRKQGVCSGPCTVYTGGALCLAAPGTNCLRATANVNFCSNEGCNVPCNQLSTCGVRLDGGFCSTPSTVSINVPFVIPDNTTSSAPRSSQTSITSTTTSAPRSGQTSVTSATTSPPRSSQTSAEGATTSAPRSSQASVTSGTTEHTASTSPRPASTAEGSGQTSAPQHSGISQRTALIAGPIVGFCAALLLVGIAILIFVKRCRRTRESPRVDTLGISSSDADWLSTRHVVSPIPFPAWRHDQQEPPPYIPIDTTETHPSSVSESPSTGKRRRGSLVSVAA